MRNSQPYAYIVCVYISTPTKRTCDATMSTRAATLLQASRRASCLPVGRWRRPARAFMLITLAHTELQLSFVLYVLSCRRPPLACSQASSYATAYWIVVRESTTRVLPVHNHIRCYRLIRDREWQMWLSDLVVYQWSNNYMLRGQSEACHTSTQNLSINE